MSIAMWALLVIAIVATLAWLREWRHCRAWREGFINNEIRARKEHAETMALIQSLKNTAANDARFPA